MTNDAAELERLADECETTARPGGLGQRAANALNECAALLRRLDALEARWRKAEQDLQFKLLWRGIADELRAARTGEGK